MTTATVPTYVVELRDGYLVAQEYRYVAPVLILGPQWTRRSEAEQRADGKYEYVYAGTLRLRKDGKAGKLAGCFDKSGSSTHAYGVLLRAHEAWIDAGRPADYRYTANY